jgi:hypothetical protein
MTHWGRLPESRTEATHPNRFDIGKHLAPACLFLECTDNPYELGRDLAIIKPPRRRAAAKDFDYAWAASGKDGTGEREPIGELDR